MESRPSMANLQLHLLAIFFAGVLMSSWVWTGSTVDTWKRFLRRLDTLHIFQFHMKSKTKFLITVICFYFILQNLQLRARGASETEETQGDSPGVRETKDFQQRRTAFDKFSEHSRGPGGFELQLGFGGLAGL